MTSKFIAKAIYSITLSAIIGATSSAALADPGHGKATRIGAPGKVSEAARTIEITMHDNYYEPENISVKEGETVRFIIKNAGEFVHEFNIATADMHKAHGPEMMMMVEQGVLLADKIDRDAAKKMQASMGHGMHDDPNSVLLEPGKSGEMIWRFPERADLEFACNVPGHYESGMVGQVKLSR
ncbi:cupredoxin domain-containing protein [Thalassospiraceae bacterium LMO-JJ14]|nr:cupredoxin domain-containing protein [Thalassospiraceae bacterium LMO-JJ14]